MLMDAQLHLPSLKLKKILPHFIPIKYKIKEITRPFEFLDQMIFFGEEMQKLKIEYKKDPSCKWKECQQVEEEPWHKTQTNQNTTNTETHNQTSDNN